MATPGPFALDPRRLQRQLDRLPAWFRAKEYQIDSVARIAGFFWLDEAAMARMIGGETSVNTDNFHYFDKQSAVRPLPPRWQLPQFQASAAPYFKPADEQLRAAIRSEQITAQRLARYGFFNSRQDLYRAYCAMPDNGNVRYWMAREFAEQLPETVAFCAAEKVKDAQAIIARHPGNARTLNNLAATLAEADRLDEALAAAEKALAMEPQNGMILDTYGWILYKQQKINAALEALIKSASFLPEHPIVLYHLGAAYYAAGNIDQARENLARALQKSSDFEGAEQARELLDKVN
jgi:tetratricopeptide (TPR) repeat protein